MSLRLIIRFVWGEIRAWKLRIRTVANDQSLRTEGPQGPNSLIGAPEIPVGGAGATNSVGGSIARFKKDSSAIQKRSS